MTIEQLLSGCVDPPAITHDLDGDCVVCPSDEETLAVQVYEPREPREVRAGQRGDWRDVRAGEEIAPGAEIRWGDGYGYPWQYVTAPERT